MFGSSSSSSPVSSLSSSLSLSFSRFTVCFDSLERVGYTLNGCGFGGLAFLCSRFACFAAYSFIGVSSSSPRPISSSFGLISLIGSSLIASSVAANFSAAAALDRSRSVLSWWPRRDQYPFDRWHWRTPSHSEVIAVSSISCFVHRVVFRRSFRSLCPSDLFRPGSFASRSLPATQGSEYADRLQKRQLNWIGRHFGCHHCGSRRPRAPNTFSFIGDHIPPNKFANGAPQRFYPQCFPCSQQQAAAVRLERRVLVSPRRVQWSDLIAFAPWHAVAIAGEPIAQAIAALA
jgi:hypothetical protein